MSQLKLLLIHNTNIFEQGGASSNRWRTLIEGLSNNGVDIQIIFTQGYGKYSEFKQYKRKGKLGNISYIYSIFLLHNSLWMSRVSDYLLAPTFSLYNAIWIRKKIKSYKPDIIWLNPTIEVFDLYNLAIRSQKKKKFKLMIELSEFDDIGLKYATNRLKLKKAYRFIHILHSKILPETDLMVVMTKKLLEYYTAFTSAHEVKTIHLPMTVDMKRFRKTQKSCNPYIAYCGTSNFAKDGVDILIKSFAMICKKYPEINLKIAAFMDLDGKRMIELISDPALLGRIEYVGVLSRDKIPEFICNAEVLLLPRPDSKQAQGGFPTKLGEYLATGNPVCATKVGEIPDYLTDNTNVFFAEPGSIQSFADAMDRALINPANAAKIGLEGKKVAELNFNMEVQSKRLHTFINENA